jgi:hypothetical protein
MIRDLVSVNDAPALLAAQNAISYGKEITIEFKGCILKGEILQSSNSSVSIIATVLATEDWI